MSKKTDLKKYKPKRSYRLTDIYRILERIYLEIIEGRYKSTHLSKLRRDYRGVKGGPKLNLRQYGKPTRHYARSPEPRYNPKPKMPSSSGGKSRSQPIFYKPRERLVYDPQVKHLLQKIEKHVREGLNAERDLDKLDVDELLTMLQERSDNEVYGKLLEKQLKEVNEAEPKLYDLNENAHNNKKKDVELIEKIEELGGDKKVDVEISESDESSAMKLSELLEKAAEKDGMSIEGPFEMDDAEFEQLIEELKSRGEVTEDDTDRTESEEQRVETEGSDEEKIEDTEEIDQTEAQSENEVEIESSQDAEVSGEPIETEPAVETESLGDVETEPPIEAEVESEAAIEPILYETEPEPLEAETT